VIGNKVAKNMQKTLDKVWPKRGCVKKTYSDQEEAMTAASRLGVSWDVHYCDECGGWHIFRVEGR